MEDATDRTNSGATRMRTSVMMEIRGRETVAVIFVKLKVGGSALEEPQSYLISALRSVETAADSPALITGPAMMAIW